MKKLLIAVLAVLTLACAGCGSNVTAASNVKNSKAADSVITVLKSRNTEDTVTTKSLSMDGFYVPYPDEVLIQSQAEEDAEMLLFAKKGIIAYAVSSYNTDYMKGCWEFQIELRDDYGRTYSIDQWEGYDPVYDMIEPVYCALGYSEELLADYDLWTDLETLYKASGQAMYE